MNQTPAALTGANVRAELARKGISQMTLAGHIGMTQASVSKRRGAGRPHIVERSNNP
jgi:predicted transcriptional regulator